MDFDERQLRAFLAIAETGSLGRAAALAHLTQPSLSRLIQSMEQRLGHRLFDRQSKGMDLTPAGEILLDHARLLAFEMQAARDQLDALRGLRRGVVRIGAVAAVMRTFVTQAVAKLLAEYPDLSVEMTEGTDSDLLSDHPSMMELARESWVMPGPSATPRIQFAARFREIGLPAPTVPVETRSVESMIAVSAASRLLCWLPGPLVAPHLASGTMRQLIVPELETEREVLLYRRRAGLLPQAARQFAAYLPLRT